MLSKRDSRKKAVGTSGDGKFLNDIETISNAFYIDKSLSRLASSTASSRSKSVGKLNFPEPQKKTDDTKNDTKVPFEKDKKSSIWSWKGLKALTHARNRRFDCRFSLLVHSVEGLPTFFNGTRLVVNWKRRDSENTTRPIRVSRGVANFEEELTHSCSVYGSRSGPHHSAKYETKHFLLYVSVHDAPEIDLGKHRVDLTRLLPLKLEELEKGSGNWTTSFRLSGKARGATMNVTFGYVVIDTNNNSIEATRVEKNVSEIISSQPISARTKKTDEDVKDLHEVLPTPRSELCDQVNVLYQNLDEEMSNNMLFENEVHDDSLSSDDPRRVELFSSLVAGEQVCGDECKKTALDEEASVFTQKDERSKNNCNYEKLENETCFNQSLMKELETALSCTSHSMNEAEDDETDSTNPESYLEFKSEYGDCIEGNSLGFDDVTESVANDFLEMLGIEHDGPNSSCSESEPESPRERLLREFEEDSLVNGGLLNFDSDYDPDEIDNISTGGYTWDFHRSSVFEDSEEMSNIEKTSALRMEDLETEALMREWGLNEDAFRHSPPSVSCGFGSPIDSVPRDDPQPLPPLAEGLGPFVQTENGGFVRSMSPELFRNGKNGGSLIMQVSNPVVVPAEMGLGVMDILKGLASIGIEKLSVQANKLMPLEDITGKTIQQIAWESAQIIEGPETERQDLLPRESDILQNVRSARKSGSSSLSNDAEYVSLDDLAPLAMDKVEALSIEGLRIQSGMSDQDAPSNISSQSIGELSALKGKTVDVGGSIGLDGTCGLQLMDIKDYGQENDVDGLMGLSLTLDEWMKLDSGEIGEDELVSERTSKILAAHHATSLDAFRGRSKGERRRGRNKKYGLLGNNFTVALMVQLRDPSRDYEAVGAPMLALIQVERVFVPPKSRIYGTVRKSDEDETERHVVEKSWTEDEIRKEEAEEAVPQYKITEVHVAGLKTEDGTKKKLWGSTSQKQSGSRWLLANGMGKNNRKNLVAKSKDPGGTLWSISSRVRGPGAGANWK